MEHSKIRIRLDDIYSKYNRRELVDPDPLMFLYNYDAKIDKEIIGLVASSLAYGRVAQILKSVKKVTTILGPSPSEYLLKVDRTTLQKELKDFKHRFTNGEEMAAFLWAIKNLIKTFGSIEDCFMAGYTASNKDMLKAIRSFTDKIRNFYDTNNSLMPDANKSSACKRLNLFLKWMVRRDDVDPGCWTKLKASELIIPLDTHMFRFGTCAGFTKRKNADMLAATEITNGFKKIHPSDPTKYDFAITRFGIRSDMCWKDLGI